jgi:hypothetical protein
MVLVVSFIAGIDGVCTYSATLKKAYGNSAFGRSSATKDNVWLNCQTQILLFKKLTHFQKFRDDTYHKKIKKLQAFINVNHTNGSSGGNLSVSLHCNGNTMLYSNNKSNLVQRRERTILDFNMRFDTSKGAEPVAVAHRLC